MGMAVIGAGYWGPNLIRNVLSSREADLRWVCDLDIERARDAVGPQSAVPVTSDLDDVLGDPEVDGVLIATPAGTHHRIALAAIDAGKHLLIEKPLASSVAEGQEIVDRAGERGVTLMCDHTFCYTSAVRKIRDVIADGVLGDVLYVDSVRINLGLVQPDIDVFWDLAPHDLSILDFILPAELRPTGVGAHGADPLGAGRACVGHLDMRLGGGALAHVHVNWLSPTKVRTFVVGGSKRTVVWDDTSPSQRVSIFDRGVDLIDQPSDVASRRAQLISYRTGDLVAPALEEVEALRRVIDEFASAIRERRTPLTDGASGLRVLRLLDASSRSLAEDGRLETV